MKKVLKIFGVLPFAVALWACGESPAKKVSKPVKENADDHAEASINARVNDDSNVVHGYSKMASNTERTLGQMKALAAMDPVTQASLKTWLPEQLGSYKRTYYATGEMTSAGVVSFTSRFTDQQDKKKVVTVEVTDGAGPGIAGMFVARLQQQLDSGAEEESENSYKKVVDRQGLKAIEEQNDLSNKSGLRFIERDRFFISLEGENIGASELWAIAEHLKTHALPGL